MSKIANSLTDLIGNTPLLLLSNYNKSLNLESRLIAKLEYFNPAGSVKDRVGYAMIKRCGRQRANPSGYGYYRTDQRQYRYCAGFCRCLTGVIN